MRAGTLGYTLGGDPDDPVCNRLDADLDSSCDDGEVSCRTATEI